MFEHNYLVFDDLGEKEVLCMACGKAIKSRVEMKSKSFQNRIVLEMSKHADYREIPVMLSDGAISFLMVCDECKFVAIEPDKITEQIKNAYGHQLRWSGKTEDVIEAILNKTERRVIRKAETSEVADAMKGAI